MREKWIDAGGNPAVRHEGVAPSNNLIKDATHRATVFVGPTLKSQLSLFYFFHSDKRGSTMRYHYEKPAVYSTIYGTTYTCNHPVYNKCTLFKINDKGLAVIQQRYCPETKTTRWGEIDPWLIDALYLHTKFEDFFNKRAGERENELYPTVTIRQIMWGLKMKPLPRERWETCFDRRFI